jgi:hypothetical protein
MKFEPVSTMQIKMAEGRLSPKSRVAAIVD